MSVKFVKACVAKRIPKWSLVADCLDQTQIKEKGELYLPRPCPEDKSPENKERYANYKRRAVFYGVTGRTLSGLVGEVFSTPPSVEVPSVLDVMVFDSDGGGLSLAQHAKTTLEGVLSFGRWGLLTDYPKTEGPVSQKQVNDGIIRPLIASYLPENIINWRTTLIGGKKFLSLVVLKEEYEVGGDEFEVKCDTQYRVLKLSIDEVYKTPYYHVEIWRKADLKNDESWVIADYFTPRNHAGRYIGEIPFVFVGSCSNDPEPDDSPLYDLADLNIAHYRNSADYEEAVHITGQPTPVISGLSQGWVKEVWKDNKVLLGSRAAIPLPTGASATLLQVAPNSMPMEAMRHKEEQMAALGARLVTPAKVARTATEAASDEASEKSVLQSASENVSEAMTRCLKWAAQFAGASEEDIVFKLSADFVFNKMSPLERQQLLLEWQSEAITFSEYRMQLRRTGVATLDDEKAKEEINSADPSSRGTGGTAEGDTGDE